MTFYDYSGLAIAYSDNDEIIYLFNGMPVAYFHENLIYDFSGRYLGVINNGWIRDNRGYCVLFSDNARGGPVKPSKRIIPVKCGKRAKPIKGVRQSPTLPVDRIQWANNSGERYFFQFSNNGA